MKLCPKCRDARRGQRRHWRQGRHARKLVTGSPGRHGWRSEMRAAMTALMCLALMPSARAATFECKKASTFAEKVLCSDSRLSAMDDELGRLYKGALAGTPNNETLKSDQKAW